MTDLSSFLTKTATILRMRIRVAINQAPFNALCRGEVGMWGMNDCWCRDIGNIPTNKKWRRANTKGRIDASTGKKVNAPRVDLPCGPDAGRKRCRSLFILLRIVPSMLLALGASVSSAANSASSPRPASHAAASASKGMPMTMSATKVAEFKEDDDVSGLDFSPDGSRIAVTTFTKLHVHLWLWKEKPRIERTLLKPPGTASYLDSDAVRYSSDGRFLAVVHTFDGDENGSGVVRIFDADTGAVAQVVAEPKGGGDVSKIAFSPDGKYFLRTYSSSTKDRDQFVVHRVDTWEKVWGLSTIPLNIMALAASPNGDLVAVGGVTLGPGVTHAAQILIIDLKARQVVRTIDDAFPKFNQVEQLAWSPDGLTIAAGGISGVPIRRLMPLERLTYLLVS